MSDISDVVSSEAVATTTLAAAANVASHSKHPRIEAAVEALAMYSWTGSGTFLRFPARASDEVLVWRLSKKGKVYFGKLNFEAEDSQKPEQPGQHWQMPEDGKVRVNSTYWMIVPPGASGIKWPGPNPPIILYQRRNGAKSYGD
ncbi:hypothetical protein HYV83_03550 [Candidatus Woesearchaeota archaeon]|nr:hypothetical protein [Candidatus Woesearchaeota archaeon]